MKTKWWFTYELINGTIRVGEIKNDPIEKVHIKILFPKVQEDFCMRIDEALAIAQGIIKTAFEISSKEIKIKEIRGR